MLGQSPLSHGVMDQSARQIKLAHRRSRPINDGRRQDTLDLQLLAKPHEDRVHTGGIDVGKLGEVADAHHYGCLRKAVANLKITTKRGREAKTNRLKDRVDAERHALSDQEFDGLVEAVQRAG